MSKVDSLIARAFYTSTRFDESDQNNNDRSSGSVSWQHRLSSVRSVSVTGSYSEVEFDQDSQEDIENSSAYLSFNSATSSSNLRLTAGYNESERENSSTADGGLFEFFFSRFSSSSEWSLLALHQLTDSTIGLQVNATAVAENITIEDTNFDVVDVVERSFVQFSTSRNTLCSSCNLNMTLTYDEQDFQEQLRDETSMGLALGFGYNLSSRLNSLLTYSIEDIEFSDLGNQEDTEQLVNLTLGYTLNDLGLALFTEWRDRDSDNPLVEFSEWRAGLSLRYQFW